MLNTLMRNGRGDGRLLKDARAFLHPTGGPILLRIFFKIFREVFASFSQVFASFLKVLDLL